MTFHQGYIADKRLAIRCKWCKKYQPTPRDTRAHEDICEENPVRSDENE